MTIHSYVVRYDSGFAPNPFYNFCTLATCKPDIRRNAKIGDWIVGSGSNDRTVRRGGHIVYAMRVTEQKTFKEYDSDPRFSNKKPYRTGSRKQSCGDNIYFIDQENGVWKQRDSFHTRANGESEPKHIRRDTGVNRVLVSDDFIYFGGYGPEFPQTLVDEKGSALCKSGRGRSCFDDEDLTRLFVKWIRSFGVRGYQNAPFEWKQTRG